MSHDKSIYPWDAESEIRGNFAIANFYNNFPRRFTADNRLHAETLLSAAGAVAGFAAQRAAHSRALRLGAPILPIGKGGNSNQLTFLSLPNGRKLYYGGFINEFLVPGSNWTLWNYLAGAMIACGIKDTELPGSKNYFLFVKETIEQGKLGSLSADEKHKPHLSIIDGLKIGWPYTEYIMKLPTLFEDRHVEPPLSEELWPFVINRGCGGFVQMVKDVIDARVATSIVMESAIIAAKIDIDLASPATNPV